MSTQNADGNAATKNGQPKKTKMRSPNYPTFGLQKAVELTDSLFRKYGRHPAPIHLVHDLFEYKRGSGAGNQAVAALKAYGLVEVDGEGDARRITVSSTGERIVRGAPDRLELLKKAAVAPPVHAEILSHYGDKGLPDDSLLQQYLVWDRPEGKRFNPDSVGDFIERFKGTLSFAGVSSSDIIPGDGETFADDEEEEVPPEEAPKGKTTKDRITRNRTMTPGLKEDVFSLDEGAVIVQWPERIQGANAEDLADWLELVGRKLKRAAEAPPPPPNDDTDDE